jgi:hypothetical protein
MNTYKCFYNGKQQEIMANTTYEAQQIYCKLNKVSNKNDYKVSVYLVSKNGIEVIHDPAILG